MKTPYEGVSIALGQGEETKVGGGTTPTFGVTDIGAARKHLESLGVRFDGDTYEIEGRSSWRRSTTPTEIPGCSRRT